MSMLRVNKHFLVKWPKTHTSLFQQKADEERVRHEEAERKARQLELEMQEKERRIAEETARKRKELKEHIDEINRQLMAAKKAQKETTPVQVEIWNFELSELDRETATKSFPGHKQLLMEWGKGPETWRLAENRLSWISGETNGRESKEESWTSWFWESNF